MKKSRSQQPNSNASQHQPRSRVRSQITKYAKKAVRGSGRFIFRPWIHISVFGKVVWVLFLISMAILVTGYLVLSREGLLIGFTLILVLNTAVLLYSARMAELFHGEEWQGQDCYSLTRDVRLIAKQLGIPAPLVMVVKSDQPLIYSTGLFPSQSRLVISEWLLRKLSLSERRALLTYELYRQHKHLTSAITAAAALSSCVQFLGTALDYTVFLPVTLLTRNRRDLGRREPIRMGLAIVAPLIGLINRLAISRRQIIKLDMEVVRHLARLFSNAVEARHDLASALFKLDAYAQVRPIHVRLCDTALFIVNPLTEFDVSSYFLVHPPLEARIKQLVGRPII